MEDKREIELPAIHGSANITVNNKHFRFKTWNPCVDSYRYSLNPNSSFEDTWYLLPNGSILRPNITPPDLLNYNKYCLARLIDSEEYLVFYCDETSPDNGNLLYSLSTLASVPFLVATYIIYWVLPDLRNLHGLTLRGYVGCLAIAYSILAMVQLIPQYQIPYDVCILFGTPAE